MQLCSLIKICNAHMHSYFMYTHLANHIIQSDAVESAMLKVDRGNYSSFNPYYDSPQTIGKCTQHDVSNEPR